MSVHNSKLMIRLIVLGEKSTGKTTLLQAYTQETLDGDSCGENSYSKDINLDGAHISQQILESNGKSSAVLSWSHGVVVLYSVDDINSFKMAEDYIKRAIQITMRDACVVLVANKIDTEDKKVSSEEGQALAEKYNCAFTEISTLSNPNDIDDIFSTLAEKIVESRGLQKSPLRLKKFFHKIGGSRKKRGLQRARTTEDDYY